MSHRYHTCKKKKEKIVGDPLSLDCRLRSQPKELAKLVQTSLQKNAR